MFISLKPSYSRILIYPKHSGLTGFFYGLQFIFFFLRKNIWGSNVPLPCFTADTDAQVPSVKPLSLV